MKMKVSVKNRFLSGVLVCLGWIAVMASAGEFTVVMVGWVEGILRLCLLAVFVVTQLSYIRLNREARS